MTDIYFKDVLMQTEQSMLKFRFLININNERFGSAFEKEYFDCSLFSSLLPRGIFQPVLVENSFPHILIKFTNLLQRTKMKG